LNRNKPISLDEIAKAHPILADSEGWEALQKNQADVTEVISNLDEKLKSVLRNQEYEYLQAYNIYVKRKEKELKSLISALNEKNSNNNFKDMRISQLEVTISKMRTQAFKYEGDIEDFKKELKSQKEKYKMETEEKEFYHK
jgi:chromosome segregation ATPase